MLYIILRRIQTLTVLLFITTILTIIYFKWKFSYWKRKNVVQIPSPTIPFGNATNPLSRKIHLGETLVNIYESLKSKGVPYGGFYVLSKPCFMPIHPDYVKLFLVKDFHHFTSRSVYYNEKDDPISAHLFCIRGDKWRTLRAKLTPTFTSGKMKTMFKVVSNCGLVMVQAMELHENSKTPVDIKSAAACYTSDLIASCAFGLDLDTIRNPNCQFRKFGEEAFHFNKFKCAMFFLASHFPRLFQLLGAKQLSKKCGNFFVNIVKEIIENREKNNIVRKDFLQLLIDIKNDKTENDDKPNLTIEEIAAQCFVFFIAGFETSSVTISCALYEISKNPQIGGKLNKEISTVLFKYQNEITYEAVLEMKYLHQIVEETLRMYPPAYYNSRVCEKNYVIPEMNVTIEEGTIVYVPLRGLHYDSEYFPNPEKFDPERFNEENKQFITPYTYFPFGEGPRNCIGMRFGLIEVKVALVHLLRKYHFSVHPKTRDPLKNDPYTLGLNIEGGIWLNVEKI